MISELDIWEDAEARAPAGQMAVDEAMLALARRPVLRAYRWAGRAVTFGYAQRHDEVGLLARGLPAIRRWTGGGTVFHGEDLTLALALPAAHPLCGERPEAIYRAIHEAVADALRPMIPGIRLAGADDCRAGAACFVSPALHDILCDGVKVCGGALRRGKAGVLYQGSLHAEVSVGSLAAAIGESVARFSPGQDLNDLAARLEADKYSTPAWNLMR
jgi:lipoate-protein ligase A